MNLEIKRYLPIGSVVLLNGANKKLMITGFCIASKAENKSEYHDYIGCLYPEGIIDTEKNFLFNHEDIKEVIAYGYSDNEEEEFKEKLSQVLKNVPTNNLQSNNLNKPSEEII